jgi:conjugal transfer pilus assembly protein TraE
MERNFFERNLNNLTTQRNFLVGLSLFLIVGLILALSFLFLKEERIIIVPSVIEKEFWVESNSISASYLEQFGLFLGQLLLSKSAYSADIHRTVLARHTEPKYLGVLKKKLIEEEETLKKQNASYGFYLNNIFVNLDRLAVTLIGDRQFFIAGQQPTNENCAYTLYFSYKGGRLLLTGIAQEKEARLI